VEALVLDGHPFGIGVQWHPEEGADMRIFDELSAAAAARRSGAGARGAVAPLPLPAAAIA
jgi:hypothetical protein